LGADLVIPAMALAFAVYFFFSIADLAWEAKANGVIIGALLVALVLAQLVRIGLRIHRGEAGLGMSPLVEPLDALPKRIGLVAITIAFIATMHWLGVTLGIALALAASLWILGVRNRKALVLVPLIVAAAVYLLFVAALQSDIPHGLIEKLLS
jgi:tetrahydromethanopterin S-methyltransferase subunit B